MMSQHRPAGYSDEESDDGLSFSVNLPHSSRNPPERATSLQPAGRLNDGMSPEAPNSSGKKFQNAKQRRSSKYWEKKREIEREQRNLPEVVDPKASPASADFFRFARQANMGLRKDLQMSEEFGVKNPEHVRAIHDWKLEDVQADYVPRTLRLHLLRSPIVAYYRGKPIYFIDNNNFEAMMDVINSSANPNEYAIDLECNDSHSFLGMIALVQVAVREAAFLVDPFSCFEKIKQFLQPKIEDGKTLKLMFGMANDIKQFQKDFGILPLGVIDLQQVYNQTRTGRDLVGLTNVCQKLLSDYRTVKSCTLADWRRRPLTPDMAVYAASDVIVLFEIWDHLRSILRKSQLNCGIASSKDILSNVFKKKSLATALEELKKKNLNSEILPQGQYDRFCLLHQWRERYAAIVDEMPASIASTDSLLRLSKTASPVAERDLQGVGLPESTLRSQMGTLLVILKDAGSDLFVRINKCQCHNCFLTGHAAVHCPFPPRKDREKKYGALHPEYKTKQNRRRRENKLKNKLAREAADNL